jgi:hypothetical protein
MSDLTQPTTIETLVHITSVSPGEPHEPTPGLVSRETTDPRFRMVCYGKNPSPEVASMRSVVMMGENVVSFSPPKSTKFAEFMKKNATTPATEFRVEEIVEGVMVNCFCVDSVWYLATKSQFLGPVENTDSTHTSTTSYSQMFVEAARGSNMDVRKLREDWSYSFILHHPLAQVVNRVTRPQLTLVRAYDIDDTDHRITERRADDRFVQNELHGTTVLTPRPFKFADMTEPIIAGHHRAHTAPTYISPGIMIISPTGERTKHRNPAYEMVRHSCAAAKQVVADLLCGIRTIRDTPVVKDLYRMYVERYIHKTTTRPSPAAAKTRTRRERTLAYHLSQLQTIYFTELKPANQKMTALRVAAYVDTLDGPSQIQTLDAVAWTVAREAEWANWGRIPPQPPSDGSDAGA